MQQNRQPIGWRRGSQHPEQRGLHGDAGAVREGSGKQSSGVLPVTAPDPVLHLRLSSTQGVVIGTGEQSQFGEVFKMMRAEEVRAAGLPGCGSAGATGLRGYGTCATAGRQKKRAARLRVVRHSFQQTCSRPESALLPYRKLEDRGFGSILFVFNFKS